MEADFAKEALKAFDSCPGSPKSSEDIWFIVDQQYVVDLQNYEQGQALPQVHNLQFLENDKQHDTPQRASPSTLLKAHVRNGPDFQLVDAATWKKFIGLNVKHDIAIPRAVYTCDGSFHVEIQPLLLWIYTQIVPSDAITLDPFPLNISRSDTYSQVLSKCSKQYEKLIGPNCKILRVSWADHPDGPSSHIPPSRVPDNEKWTPVEYEYKQNEGIDLSVIDENVVLLAEVLGSDTQHPESGVAQLMLGCDSTVKPSTPYGLYDTLPTTFSNPFTKGHITVADALVSGGCVGLQNLGNTCFMNSALQCLSHILPFTQYFISRQFEEHLNRDNPLGMGGRLAIEYANFLADVWSSAINRNQHHRSYSNSVIPRRLKQCIGKFAPQFIGYQQQDSQEFLAFLLDGLHEDLNLIKKKPYIETIEGDDQSGKKIAEESWRRHKQRNNSVVVDLFQGQYRSRLQCPICGKISIVFDPFMYLSVPVPRRTVHSLHCTILPGVPGLAPVSVGLRLQGEVSQNSIKSQLAKHIQVSSASPNNRKIFEPFQKVGFFGDPRCTPTSVQAANILIVQYSPVDKPLTIMSSSATIKEPLRSHTKHFAYAIILPSDVVQYLEGSTFDPSSFRGYIYPPCTSSRQRTPTRQPLPSKSGSGSSAKKRRAATPDSSSPVATYPTAPSPPLSSADHKASTAVTPQRQDSGQTHLASLPPTVRQVANFNIFYHPSSLIHLFVVPLDFTDSPRWEPVVYPSFLSLHTTATCRQVHREVSILFSRLTAGDSNALLAQLTQITSYLEQLRISRTTPADPSPNPPQSSSLPPTESDTKHSLMNTIRRKVYNKAKFSTATLSESTATELPTDSSAEGSTPARMPRGKLSEGGEGFHQSAEQQRVDSQQVGLDIKGNCGDIETISVGLPSHDKNFRRVLCDDVSFASVLEELHEGRAAVHDEGYTTEGARQVYLLYVKFSTIDKLAIPVVEDSSVKYSELPALRSEESVDIRECISEFLKSEQLGPDNMWYCNKCKDHVQAYKKIELWRTPQILILHLKRFYQQSRYSRSKNDILVTFPHRTGKYLDLSDIVHPDAREQFKAAGSLEYELMAISEHIGALGGGHYTAKARCRIIDHEKWVDFDDQFYRVGNEQEVCKAGAYVLFFQRRGGVSSPLVRNPSSASKSTCNPNDAVPHGAVSTVVGSTRSGVDASRGNRPRESDKEMLSTSSSSSQSAPTTHATHSSSSGESRRSTATGVTSKDDDCGGEEEDR